MTPYTDFRRLRRRIVLFVVALIALDGCSDRTLTSTNRVRLNYSDGVPSTDSTLAPNLAVAGETAAAAGTCTVSPVTSSCATIVLSISPSSPLLRHSGRAPEYAGDITVTFVAPVTNVSVTSRGALKCSGSNGILVALDTSGQALPSIPMRLQQASDCAFDDVTFGTVGATPRDVPVSSITIRPPSPFIFDVPREDMAPIEGRVTLLYTITVGILEGMQMSCTPRDVERGQVVTCAMTALGGASLERPRWTFDSPAIDGSLLSRPIAYPSADSDDPPITTWSGVVVTAGTVRAYADVAGRTDSASVSLTVRPRPWRANGVVVPRVNVALLGQGSLRVLPRVASDLGLAGFNIQIPSRCAPPQCIAIGSGPNRGLIYYTTLPLSISEYSVQINDSALAPNSAWRASFASSRVNGRCSRSELNSFNLRSLIEQHEGTNPDAQPNSHLRIFRDALDSAGVRLMETAIIGVAPGPAALREEVMAIAYRDASQIDSARSTRNPVRIPGGCSLF